jgi:hypothetical protein
LALVLAEEVSIVPSIRFQEIEELASLNIVEYAIRKLLDVDP